MHYQSITLELLQECPKLYGELRTSRTLLQAMERSAYMLRDRHLLWKDALSRCCPTSDPSQIASAALELAIQDIRDSLPAESLENADIQEEPFSLDAAMASLPHPTRPA
jgi:hypothetical protein